MIEVIETIARIGFTDVVDWLVTAFLIYQALLLIRGTRGWQMTVSVAGLILFYYTARLLNLLTVNRFLENFIPYFIFALVVIFQPEIRRALTRLGRGAFFRRFFQEPLPIPYDEIVLAATTLSSQRIGALIVIERQIGLRNHIESGIKVDAFLTYDLLLTIFNPKSPLHDGAVIVQGDRIAAAACFLPLTLDPYLSKELGTRHRAAIGVSREGDALSVVVSEETGKISLVVGREITRGLDGPRLLKLLKRHMNPDRTPSAQTAEAVGKSAEQSESPAAEKKEASTTV